MSKAESKKKLPKQISQHLV